MRFKPNTKMYISTHEVGEVRIRSKPNTKMHIIMHRMGEVRVRSKLNMKMYISTLRMGEIRVRSKPNTKIYISIKWGLKAFFPPMLVIEWILAFNFKFSFLIVVIICHNYWTSKCADSTFETKKPNFNEYPPFRGLKKAETKVILRIILLVYVLLLLF